MTKRTREKYMGIATEIIDNWKGDFSGGGFEENREILMCELEIEGELTAGASKAVLIRDDCDYVIKIPFKKNFSNEVYTGARLPIEVEKNSIWDYCQKEVNIYNIAKKEGLACLFCEMIFLFEYKEQRVYLQKKVSSFISDSTQRVSESDMETFFEIVESEDYSVDDSFPVIFLIQVIKTYGKDLLFKLSKLLDDLRLSDFHSSNVAIRNGFPILVDYAGFNW